MAGAGFYPIHTDELRLGADGTWFADGEPVLHKRLAKLFSRNVRRKPDGTWEIYIDDQYRADIVVDDTAFVVVDVDLRPDGSVLLHLSDDQTEVLDADGLSAGPGDVLYCRIQDGRERARFLRSAYQHLAPSIESQDGTFLLRVGPRSYRIHTKG